MEGFTLRDYIVSALIITGVLAAWFFLLATLMGFIGRQISLALAIIASVSVYLLIKARNKNG
ncbi:hypothetical protein KW803_01685 [Candidatus Saccharibacteria bacterium]|nr:hypothetical protein [Candidatus Saccharibacteria bacterium]